MGVAQNRAKKYVSRLNFCMRMYGISTPIRVSHFIAQLLHESGRLKYTEENMNYSSDRLRCIFPVYFDAAQAVAYHRKAEAIGSRVYANRMGNGDESSGDGYRYRGRGFIQLTGKNNYRAFAKWANDDNIVSNPRLVATEYAVESAIYYWDANNLDRYADDNDVEKLTRAINGGVNGLNDRIELTNKLLDDFGVKI